MKELNRDRIQPLVEKAVAGDRNAFSEIVRIMMKPIVALTYRMTQNRDVAFDLAQDTFVAAWQNLSGFRGEAHFDSWLYRIATNKTLNHLASPKSKVVSADDYSSSETLDYATPEKILMRKELKNTVINFMATLPVQQRLVFDLRFYQNLSFGEIAEITGNAEGTAKTNYREAVKKLREYMKKKGWQA
ncbi:MAG: sigma-70 family RNA polymerase sigma factor [candidate division Zixibacteria bacterium]|nr:sigma-70 family RNA polymerase sigma factor [candidate division Zixibacteria bacterium]MDD5426534.1 sigma-70 family RNA polymerase sigma factor [candidate division Zixibacteria bacterium]